MCPSSLESNTRMLNRVESSFYLVLCQDQIVEALYDWFDHAALVYKHEIDDWLRHARRAEIISRDEYLRGLRTDIIARDDGIGEREGDLGVVETAVFVKNGDLHDAAKSAGIMRRVTGANVFAFVVTYHEWTPGINDLADRLGVNLIRFQPVDFALPDGWP